MDAFKNMMNVEFNRKIIPTEEWRNIPRCVTDATGDLRDRVSFLENKILEIKQESMKTLQTIKEIENGQVKFVKDTNALMFESLQEVNESVDAKLGEMSEKSEITFTNLNELIDLSKQEMSAMRENTFSM